MKSSNIQISNLEQGLTKYFNSLNLDNKEQDLVHGTILKTIQKRQGLKRDEYLNTLTNTIQKKAFISSYRRALMQNSGEATVDNLFLIFNEETDYDLTALFNKIIRNIEQLNEKLINPFKMYVEGYSYQQIADAVKLKIKTIKKRIFTARLQLMLYNN